MVLPTKYALLSPEDHSGIAEMLAIYQASIVPSEQKSAAELAAMHRDPRYKIVLAREGEHVIGFAIMFFPSGGGFWLLEYMAITARARSLGHGEGIFRAAKRLAADVTGDAPCVLEVDQPASAPDDDAARRLRFYGRLGCRRIAGLNYILPLESAGTPPPMWLLVHGIEHHVSVPTETATQWLKVLYAEVYKKTPEDSRLIAMLSSIGGKAALPLEQLD